jgi:hypothetical protein
MLMREFKMPFSPTIIINIYMYIFMKIIKFNFRPTGINLALLLPINC